MSELIFFAIGLAIGIVNVYSSVTEDQFHQAQEMCKANEGLSVYYSSLVDNPRVNCNNGAKFTLEGGK